MPLPLGGAARTAPCARLATASRVLGDDQQPLVIEDLNPLGRVAQPPERLPLGVVTKHIAPVARHRQTLIDEIDLIGHLQHAGKRQLGQEHRLKGFEPSQFKLGPVRVGQGLAGQEGRQRFVRLSDAEMNQLLEVRLDARLVGRGASFFQPTLLMLQEQRILSQPQQAQLQRNDAANRSNAAACFRGCP